MADISNIPVLGDPIDPGAIAIIETDIVEILRELPTHNSLTLKVHANPQGMPFAYTVAYETHGKPNSRYFSFDL